MSYYNNPGQINDEAINIAGGKTFQVVQVADIAGNVTGTGSAVLGPLLSKFTIPAHDEVALTYDVDGQLTTVIHKSSGADVSTIIISYDGSGNVIGISQSL